MDFEAAIVHCSVLTDLFDCCTRMVGCLSHLSFSLPETKWYILDRHEGFGASLRRTHRIFVEMARVSSAFEK
jgi:hypothetical protein